MGDGLADSAVDDRFETLSPEDDMIIMYTSGTTGHPKGAVHSHAPVRNTVERMQLYEMSAADTQMSYLPLFHIYGYSEIAMGSMAVGARQILMETFDAERALDVAACEAPRSCMVSMHIGSTCCECSATIRVSFR